MIPHVQTIQKARLRSGPFVPGQSGNQGGRPKDEYRVAELARSYKVEAINTLVELMRDGKDERVRGTAAQALLERGWGKAKVEVVTNAEGDVFGISKIKACHSRSSEETMKLDSLTASARSVVRSDRWIIDRPYFVISGLGMRF